MKIICIGLNYRSHAIEMGRPFPAEPVVFLKPDSSLIKKNKPFFLPDFSTDIQYEVEVVVKYQDSVKAFPLNMHTAITMRLQLVSISQHATIRQRGVGVRTKASMGDFQGF
jgi:hypothetical protein